MKKSNEIYNSTLAYLQPLKKIPPKYSLRTIIKSLFEKDIKEIQLPNTVLEYSIFEALLAKKAGKKTEKREQAYSISIDGRCVKNGIIYTNNTKRFIKENIGKINKEEMQKYTIKNLPKTQKICRLVYSERKFYIIVPIPITVNKKINRDIISLDPGVRSFLAYYDGESCGEIGKNIYLKLKRLQKNISNIQKKVKKLPGKKRKNLRKAKNRIEEKIKHLTEDLHKKTINFLSHYKYVLLPEFKVKELVEKTKNKHLKRSLLSLSHFKFKLRLTQKASEIGNTIIICNEAWTSKTCTCCGNIHSDLGSAKNYSCRKCLLEIDRDINGARNILLRVLRGGSSN